MRNTLKYRPNQGFQAMQLAVAPSASIELLYDLSDLTTNMNEKREKQKTKTKKKTNEKKEYFYHCLC